MEISLFNLFKGNFLKILPFYRALENNIIFYNKVFRFQREEVSCPLPRAGFPVLQQFLASGETPPKSANDF